MLGSFASDEQPFRCERSDLLLACRGIGCSKLAVSRLDRVVRLGAAASNEAMSEGPWSMGSRPPPSRAPLELAQLRADAAMVVSLAVATIHKKCDRLAT